MIPAAVWLGDYIIARHTYARFYYTKEEGDLGPNGKVFKQN